MTTPTRNGATPPPATPHHIAHGDNQTAGTSAWALCVRTSALYRDWAPSSQPKYLVGYAGLRFRAWATSTMLGMTVLMPLPRPSILLWTWP